MSEFNLLIYSKWVVLAYFFLVELVVGRIFSRLKGLKQDKFYIECHSEKKELQISFVSIFTST